MLGGMWTRSRLSALGAALACAALASPAQATFSIVAADPAAGAIGSAGASCVPYPVIRILRVAAGKGLLLCGLVALPVLRRWKSASKARSPAAAGR